MRRFAILLALPTLLLACGGDDEGDDGCADVAGTWEITAHCDPSAIGNDVIITQTECAITVDWGGGDDWDGTVSGSRLSVSGDRGDGVILTCGGTVSGNSWSSSCTPDPCDVTVTKK